jgi:hypothetical protein
LRPSLPRAKGRKGIWTVVADPKTLDEVLAFSLQKLEALAHDALAVQAKMVIVTAGQLSFSIG